MKKLTKHRYSKVIILILLALILAGGTAYAKENDRTGATIQYLKNRIENTYQKVYTGNEIIQQIESRLDPIRAKIETLNDQLDALDEEYRNSQKNLQEVKKQITVKEKEIELLNNQIARYETELRDQRNILIDLGKLLYTNQKKYIDFSKEQKKVNTVKLLLSSSILSEVAINNEYLQTAGKVGADVLKDSEENAEKYQLTKNILDEKKEKLDKLKKKLELQKQIIATQKEAKKILISFTQGSEEAYQDLLKRARDEQLKIVDEVKSYQGQLASIEKLLNQAGVERLLSESLLDWPVDPSGGITAYYHDEAYHERFEIEHNAVDFRAAEGTEIQAPAPGYVFKVHDGGMGYSYVILAHQGNLMTVYGHLLELWVEEGDIIQAGELIGLTGGRPGTPGAGYLTTGPHLHFEVYRDGKHIDPLTVLPIFDGRLPKSSIPTEFF